MKKINLCNLEGNINKYKQTKFSYKMHVKYKKNSTRRTQQQRDEFTFLTIQFCKFITVNRVSAHYIIIKLVLLVCMCATDNISTAIMFS